MLVYDAIASQLPTKHVPILMQKYANRFGTKMDTVPHTSQYCRDVNPGIGSDVRSTSCGDTDAHLKPHARIRCHNAGVHINSVHITDKANCYVISVDQLPGGTAEDYHTHICDSVNRLAEIYTDTAL